MLESALKFAEKNIPVFPVHGLINGQCTCGKSGCPSAGKHPVPFNGFKSATCDPSQVEQWWTHHPYANIGLPTGRVSGLVVIDIDPRHGGDESFFDLEKQYQAFPPTKEVLTGGGGQHLYFQRPPAGMACKTGKSGLFRGIDIKGDGGYVIAPPSVHISGHRYEWEVASYERDLAELPEWFLELLAGLEHPFSGKDAQAGVKTAGTPWGHFLKACFPEGQRNTSLTQITGYFLAKRMDGYLILDICQSINQTTCKPPLPENEVVQIVNSIALKEARKMEGAYYG